MRSVVFPVLLSLLLAACQREDATNPAPNASMDTVSAPAVTAASLWLDSARTTEEREIYLSAARAAWRFADRNFVPATGFIRPFDFYANVTMWDLASGFAALFCARELDLIPAADYELRMRRALSSLRELPLFDEISFNKEYAVDSGRMIGLSRQPSARGYGISATDTGRMLLWLRIIAVNHPQFAADVDSVVRRIDFDELIDDGYLKGHQISRRTKRVRSFQEGRIGYEQYAASGFAAWGHMADNAMDIGENAEPVKVSGIDLNKDRRGSDRLTSEPFILLGLEAGWPAEFGSLARSVLAAQEARHRQTGELTMVSEDAINIPPHYFFYYNVYSRHGPWTLDVQLPGAELKQPRWVSTKATFAWHALEPNAYTRTVLDTVRKRALVGDVWGSGVFVNGRPTGNPNINTAAVVLESALYRQRGQPLIRPVRPPVPVVDATAPAG